MIAVVFWWLKSFVIRRMLIGFLCGADLFDGWSNHTKIASTSLSTLTIFFTGFFSYFLRVWGGWRQTRTPQKSTLHSSVCASVLFVYRFFRRLSNLAKKNVLFRTDWYGNQSLFYFAHPLCTVAEEAEEHRTKEKEMGDATLNKNNPNSRSTIRLIIPDCSMTRKEELVVVGGFE